jgi:ribonuclease VapC
MIAIDTSAIMAILLNEPEADACIAALEGEEGAIVMSSGTLAEILIVAGRRNVGPEASRLIEGLGIEIVLVNAASAKRIADAYAQWGKGVHPAGLNFGDCFAYEIATERNCPLLFVGDDFSRTDVDRQLRSAS